MSCKVVVSIVEESLAGDIGDDWRYSLEARAYNPTLQSVGTIRVAEHRLQPGSSQAPPNAGAVALSAGPCASAPRIRLVVQATEVDWLIDDSSSDELTIPIECPGPGGSPTVLEPEVAVRVKEAPGFFGGEATFTLKVRLVASCA